MPRPGIYNDVTIQKQVVEALVRDLGPNVWRAMDGDRRVNLLPYLMRARNKCLPGVDLGTIRRWFKHYAKYGEVPAVARRRRFKKKRYRGRMSDAHLEVLRRLVDENHICTSIEALWRQWQSAKHV